MAQAPLSDRDVIKTIGADALLAHGYTEHAIKKWMQRGIAWPRRRELKQLAAKHRIKLPADFVERGPTRTA